MLYMITETCSYEDYSSDRIVIGVYTKKEAAEAEVKAIIEEGRLGAKRYNESYSYHHCRFCNIRTDDCSKCLYEFVEHDNGYCIYDGKLEDWHGFYIKEIPINKRIG